MRKTLTAFISVTITLLLTAASTPSEPKNVYTPASSLAALGDSLNVGANSCGLWIECLEESWTTGQDSDEVESFAEKITTLPQAEDKLEVYNNAQANTKVEDLTRQALLAVNQEAEFITILSGANDACTYRVDDITSEDKFRKNVEEALNVLNERLPYSKIFIASIPDITSLWQTGRQDPNIVKMWDEYRMCNSLMVNPNGFTLTAIERRKTVTEAIENFNKILEEECLKASNCLFDNYALYNHDFSLEEISIFDGFHPSTLGQAKIANVLWNDYVKIHAQVLRGTTSSSSAEAPLVVVLNPKDGQQVSGKNFRLLVQIKNTHELNNIYADTQLGPIDLQYDRKLNLWFLEVDTTLAPSGLTTTFRVVAVDKEDNIGVSENVTVEVDNSEITPNDGIVETATTDD